MLRPVAALARGLDIPIICQVQTVEDAEFLRDRRRLHESVTSFICNSRFTAGVAQLPEERLSIFFQPVIASSERQPTFPPTHSHRRIGLLGRISKTKGHYVFLDSASRIVRGGRQDIRFVVIGEGLTENETNHFRAAVERAGMGPWFEFRGFNPDVASELQRLHAVAIPSIAEPLGRVVLDACLARRPVIVSDSGGLGEFAGRMKIEILVPPHDSLRLAREIEQVFDNYDEVFSNFHQTAARIIARLAPEPYFAAITSILQSAAKGNSTALEWFGSNA
jgi:glycosyltransferase involved in cell wall biosynthesis